jgi:RHS repeat-associated protein
MVRTPRHRFEGRPNAIDLYYYRARYYDAQLGRFLETDPVLYADQMNLYAYVGNSPLNATDPSGLAGCASRVGGGGQCTGLSGGAKYNIENGNALNGGDQPVVRRLGAGSFGVLASMDPPGGGKAPSCSNPNGCQGRPMPGREDGRCRECGTRRDQGEVQDGRNRHDGLTDDEFEARQARDSDERTRQRRENRRNNRSTEPGMEILRRLQRPSIYLLPPGTAQEIERQHQWLVWNMCVDSGRTDCGSPPREVA